MRLTVNGRERQFEEAATLETLLQKLGIKSERVAVLVNEQVVSARNRAAWKLRDADRIEILAFAGGG